MEQRIFLRYPTLPKASVAEIDSLFLARPARAASQDYNKIFQPLPSLIVGRFLKVYRPQSPPHSSRECGCSDFERPAPPRRSRSSPRLWTERYF